jgi:DNA-binding NarL/FixJ family response regulator
MISSDESIRIVLVDDHAIVRSGIRDALKQGDDISIVGEAEDANGARQLVQAQLPDVLILDLRLPDESGIEVANWARAAYPDMAVLILSAFDDAPFLSAALKAGVKGYILKTASPEEILQGVRDAHAARPAFDETMAQKVMDYIVGKPHQGIAYEALSDRELEVLTLAAKGQTNKLIGESLDISDRTVQGHLSRVFRKLQVNSRTEAVMRAVHLGLLPAESLE